MADLDRRFREAHDYAEWHGFIDGFPTFHEADYGDGVVYGTYLVSGSTADFRNVPRDEYGVFHIEDVPEMIRAANDWAYTHGYAAGLPNFHQGDDGNGVMLGTLLFKQAVVDTYDVPADELGVWDRNQSAAMMQAASDYAYRKGYAAGFPTFHEADYGQGLMFGMVMLHAGTASWRDVPADLLARYSDPPTPTAFILCRPSDVPAPDGSAQRWADILMPGGADPSNLVKYWQEVSFGQYDANGSRVFGWLDIGHTQAEIDSFQGKAQRRQLSAWGQAAAQAAGVKFGDFKQFAYCYNINGDVGSAGGPVVVFAYEEGRPFEPTFLFHEFGHALGLPESSSTGDVEYEDQFDIMSAMRVFSFRDAQGRENGPGAASINLENLGFLHRSRVWRGWPAHPQVVELVALNRADLDGYLAARVVFPHLLTPVFYLEYREETRWDRGLPGPRVLVQTRNSKGGAEIYGDPGGDPVGALAEGEELVFPDFPANVVIRVEAIDTTASKARVRLWAVAPAGPRTVRVSGILYDPPAVEWEHEFAVVRNDQATTVDLAGWTLTDVAGHLFTFGQLRLEPGHQVRVWTGPGSDDAGNVHIGRHAAIWNNDGDTATMRNPAGSVVSTYSYGDGGQRRRY